MRVFIVDDEPLVRVGIKTILQNRRSGFDFAGDAGDGETALRMLDAARPDILLVDVRMPGMSGLDFIAAARPLLPGARFIILTGHRDFDYARQAIRLGVTDYVLKSTIDSQEMLALLRRVRFEIRRDGRGTEVTVRRGSGVPRERERQLQRIVLGESGGAAAAAAANRLLPRRLVEEGLHAMAVQTRPACGSATTAARGTDTSLRAAANICSEAIRGQGVALEAGDGLIAILVSREPGGTPADETRRLFGLAADCEKSLKEYMDLSARVGICRNPGGAGELASLFAEARRALEQGFFDASRVTRLVAEPGRAPGSGSWLREEKRTLARLAASADHAVLRQRLEAAADRLAAERPTSAEAVRSLYASLLGDICDSIGDQGAGRRCGAAGEVRAACARATSLDELRALAREVVEAAEVEPHASIRVTSLMEKVRAFVRANAAEKLQLEDAARHAGISPSYLSRLFASTTGTHFHDFVAAERMALAREMIASGMKLDDVAERLGFAEAASLSRAFKRVEGMTPRQFRDGVRVR